MSIENNIERIAVALERIANHLTSGDNPVQTRGKPKPTPQPGTAKKAPKANTPVKETKVTTSEPPKPKPVTKSEAQDELARVANILDRDTALGILAEFDGAVKVSDVPPEQYQDLIDLCDKTLVEAEAAGVA